LEDPHAGATSAGKPIRRSWRKLAVFAVGATLLVLTLCGTASMTCRRIMVLDAKLDEKIHHKYAGEFQMFGYQKLETLLQDFEVFADKKYKGKIKSLSCEIPNAPIYAAVYEIGERFKKFFKEDYNNCVSLERLLETVRDIIKEETQESQRKLTETEEGSHTLAARGWVSCLNPDGRYEKPTFKETFPLEKVLCLTKVSSIRITKLKRLDNRIVIRLEDSNGTAQAVLMNKYPILEIADVRKYMDQDLANKNLLAEDGRAWYVFEFADPANLSSYTQKSWVKQQEELDSFKRHFYQFLTKEQQKRLKWRLEEPCCEEPVGEYRIVGK